MKKWMSILLCTALLTAFASCKNNTQNNTAAGSSGDLSSQTAGDKNESNGSNLSQSAPESGTKTEEDLSKQARNLEGLPDDFPMDEMVPLEAENMVKETMQTENGNVGLVTYTIPKSREDVISFYTEALEKMGAEEVIPVESQTAWSCTASFGKNGEKKKLDISVSQLNESMVYVTVTY